MSIALKSLYSLQKDDRVNRLAILFHRQMEMGKRCG